MENEEQTYQDVEHQKRMESCKEDVIRITNLLELALRETYIEAPITKPVITTQLVIMTPFHQQNSSPSGTSLESQFIIHYSYIQPTSLIRVPPEVNLIWEDIPKEKPMEKACDKQKALEKKNKGD